MSEHLPWIQTAQWMLIGPFDHRTPSWLKPLLLTCGTSTDWAAVGVPMQFDGEGRPASLRIDGRDFAFSWIMDSEAAGYPDCRSRVAPGAEQGTPAR